MIFVISKKAFDKNAKKLVEKKEYVIGDAMDDDDSQFIKYARVATMDGFAPPAKLIKAKLNKDSLDEVGIDSDKVKKLQKKYFGGKQFKTAVMACTKDIAESSDSHNIFVVVTNKAYKAYADKIVHHIHKILNIDFKVAYTMDDIKGDKSLLKKCLKDSKIKELQKVINRFEKDLK